MAPSVRDTEVLSKFTKKHVREPWTPRSILYYLFKDLYLVLEWQDSDLLMSFESRTCLRRERAD
jgi:hypothetical protein